MAIDPPYRTDPFRNIVNVHWEQPTDWTPSPAPSSITFYVLAESGEGMETNGTGCPDANSFADQNTETNLHDYYTAAIFQYQTVEDPYITVSNSRIEHNEDFTSNGYIGPVELTFSVSGTSVSASWTARLLGPPICKWVYYAPGWYGPQYVTTASPVGFHSASWEYPSSFTKSGYKAYDSVTKRWRHYSATYNFYTSYQYQGPGYGQASFVYRWDNVKNWTD